MIDEKKLIEALKEDKESLFSEVFYLVDLDNRDYLMNNLERFINKQPKVGEKSIQKPKTGNSCADIACEYYQEKEDCPARHHCAGYEKKGE